MRNYIYQVEIVPNTEAQEEDLQIEFPEELVTKYNWQVGDTLEWIIHDDYAILRKKLDENSSTE